MSESDLERFRSRESARIEEKLRHYHMNSRRAKEPIDDDDDDNNNNNSNKNNNKQQKQLWTTTIGVSSDDECVNS